MKTSYGTILVLAVATVLLAIALPCWAEEKEEENIWLEAEPKWEQRRFELTEEGIERIMNRLKEVDPEKAEELKQLREKDLEKFKTELREAMRQQFGKRFRERIKEQTKERMKKHSRLLGPGGMPPETGMQRQGEQFGPGHIMPEMGMHWKYDKYLDWLKENYAEEAEKLAELSEREPGLYWKRFGLGLKKYGRIAEAARENPRLAEVLKKDLELRQQQDKLLGEIEASNDKEKEELIKDLKEVLSNRFDVIVERKQMEYDLLLKKLERLKNEVEQRKTKMEKWKDAKFKDESIKARLEELLGKSDKFTW